MLTRLKRLISLILLLVWCCYYINTHCFLHTHVVDSHIVTHSHPFSSSQHQHSAADFVLIASLTTLLFVAPLLAALIAAFFPQTSKLLSFYLSDKISQKNFTWHHLRAPPVC